MLWQLTLVLIRSVATVLVLLGSIPILSLALLVLASLFPKSAVSVDWTFADGPPLAWTFLWQSSLVFGVGAVTLLLDRLASSQRTQSDK